MRLQANKQIASWDGIEGLTLRTFADFLTISSKILIMTIFTRGKDVERRERLLLSLFYVGKNPRPKAEK